MSSAPAKNESAIRGELSYHWAQEHMEVIKKLVERYVISQPLAGYKLGFCLHITKETSVLLMAAKNLGAEIAACAANPLSTQDDIASFLARQGMSIYAWRGQSEEEFNKCLGLILNFNPNILTDDGAELHTRAHALRWKGIIGGTEETTTGIVRIRALQTRQSLLYPVIGVNETPSKFLFDNRFGTGQSTLDGLMRATGILVAGKNVVVCGYGWVGKGVAKRASGLGARVIVTEIDYIRALEAYMDGYRVERLVDIATSGDVFITCTGQTKVIRKEHVVKMKPGAILANAGHFDVEIDVSYLYEQDSRPAKVREDVESFSIHGKKIYLIGRGRVINLVCGEGHPPEVMSFSFANQLLSIIFLCKFHEKLRNRLYRVPRQIDRTVVRHAIEALKIKIDRLNSAQKEYRKSFLSNSLR